MYPILLSATITSMMFLCDAFLLKSKRKFHQYFMFFLLIAGVQFFFQFRDAHANTYEIFKQKPLITDFDYRPWEFDYKEDKEPANKFRPKTEREIRKNFIAQCKQKKDYHYSEGCRCYSAAKDGCLAFPNIEDQKKADFCFNSAIAALYPGSPSEKILAGILALGAQYFSAVISEWRYIESRLNEAKYHYEMEEHYTMMLNYNIMLLSLKKD